MKHKGDTITGRIRAALARDPNMDAHEVARIAGCTAQRAREMRWRVVDPERARLQNERYRRSTGQRPIGEVHAEIAARTRELTRQRTAALLERRERRQTRKDQRTDAVLKLRAEGLSFTDCAQRLKMTRGIIAGIVYRAFQEARI